jgi:hypothetical protein
MVVVVVVPTMLSDCCSSVKLFSLVVVTALLQTFFDRFLRRN